MEQAGDFQVRNRNFLLRRGAKLERLVNVAVRRNRDCCLQHHDGAVSP